MKKHLLSKMLIIAVAGILAFTGLIWAASTVTQTLLPVNKEVAVLTYAWTADATSAEVSATESSWDVDGWVFLVITNPGSPAPTDNYDLVLKDAEGIDIMGGALANRDTANSEQAIPQIMTGIYGARFVDGKLTLEVTGNAVTSAEAEVKVFFYR